MIEGELNELDPGISWNTRIEEAREESERLRKEGNGKGFTFYSPSPICLRALLATKLDLLAVDLYGEAPYPH